MIGSPIYFDFPTGVVRSFLERLLFPILAYNPKIDAATGKWEMSLHKKTVPTAMIYTMGRTEEGAKEFRGTLDENTKFLQQLFGYTETLCSYKTYQFDDYSRSDVMEGTEQSRRKQREEQFPIHLKNAYALGRRSVQKANTFASRV